MCRDDAHLWSAVRYVERNPVKAGMVEHAEDYPWSSAAFHLGLKQDRLIRSHTQWGRPVEDWHKVLAEPEEEQMLQMIRSRTHCGLPCGDNEFISKLAEAIGHPLVLRQRGRPRKQ